MLSILLVFIALLLLAIAISLREMLIQQRASNLFWAQVLTPDTSGELDVSDSRGEPRSLIDQIAMLVSDSAASNRRISRNTAYVRSFLWETQDRRLLDDLRCARLSSRWKRAFPGDEEAHDGLWRREYDLEEGFERDVVAPSLARSSGAEPPQPNSTDDAPVETNAPKYVDG